MNDANDYAQRRKDLINSIRTGDLVTDFWGTTWRVKRYDRAVLGLGSAFLCDHVHGPLLRRPDDEPRSKERWIPLANINYRSVQGYALYTIGGTEEDPTATRFSDWETSCRADAQDRARAYRMRGKHVVSNGCGFIKAD
jgi:hypothetical protein